jgi:tRNA threonylcarbamoyladenosine biosynthesis protein TsaB
MRMNILAFDTSTPACTVALCVSGTVFFEHEVLPRKQSDYILLFIDRLLLKAGISRAELDLIVCGVGPGSFMGVRLAVSVAQGLAFALQIPVLPLSTLQVLAQSCKNERVLAAWDARMGQIYLGHYCRDSYGIMRPECGDYITDPRSVVVTSANHWFAVGNAWSVYADSIPDDLQTRWQGCDADCYPHAAAMVTLAQHTGADYYLSPEQLQPVYLRAAVSR